jgi:hypothetical protein
MRIRSFPLIVGAAAGAVHGVLRDADAVNGRTANTQQWSTFFEAGAVVAGYVAESMGHSSDVTNPLIYGGLFSLASRAAYFYAKQNNLVKAGQLFAMPAAAMSHVGAAPQLVPADSRRQPAGILA